MHTAAACSENCAWVSPLARTCVQSQAWVPKLRHLSNFSYCIVLYIAMSAKRKIAIQPFSSLRVWGKREALFIQVRAPLFKQYGDAGVFNLQSEGRIDLKVMPYNPDAPAGQKLAKDEVVTWSMLPAEACEVIACMDDNRSYTTTRQVDGQPVELLLTPTDGGDVQYEGSVQGLQKWSMTIPRGRWLSLKYGLQGAMPNLLGWTQVLTPSTFSSSRNVWRDDSEHGDSEEWGAERA